MKIISLLLIMSLTHYFLGCYNINTIVQKDEIQNCLENKEEIYALTTSDIIKYNFKDNRYNYKILNNTLYGYAKKETSDPWQKFEHIEISLAEINTIEIQEIEPVKSGLFLIGVTASVTYLIIYGLSHASYF